MSIRHPAWDEIEPSARVDGGPSYARPGEHEIELSKAISLKRIADALDLSNDEGIAHTIWTIAMHNIVARGDDR